MSALGTHSVPLLPISPLSRELLRRVVLSKWKFNNCISKSRSYIYFRFCDRCLNLSGSRALAHVYLRHSLQVLVLVCRCHIGEQVSHR